MKYFFIFVISLGYIGGTFANCRPNPDFETVCGINGQTYTNNCIGRSDTSSRAIPPAYTGACDDYPDLSLEIQEMLLTAVHTFFASSIEYVVFDYGQASYYDTRERIPEGSRHMARAYLTESGKKFVEETFFPRIQQKIISLHSLPQTEHIRWIISVLHYLAYTIGYDYTLVMHVEEFASMQ